MRGRWEWGRWSRGGGGGNWKEKGKDRSRWEGRSVFADRDLYLSLLKVMRIRRRMKSKMR